MDAEHDLGQTAAKQGSDPNVSALLSTAEKMLKEELAPDPLTMRTIRDEEMPDICRELNHKERQICRLAAGGMNPKHIAETLGYRVTPVTSLLKTSIALIYMDWLQGRLDDTLIDVGVSLQRLSVKALDRLVELIDKKEISDKNLLATVVMIMDRAGFRPAETINIKHAGAITEADIAALNNANKELDHVIVEARKNSFHSIGGQEPPALGEGVSS